MKLTKNKELRALIKRHEEKRNRPKGVKMLDKILQQVNIFDLNDVMFYVPHTYLNEFKTKEHKGIKICFTPIKKPILLSGISEFNKQISKSLESVDFNSWAKTLQTHGEDSNNN